MNLNNYDEIESSDSWIFEYFIGPAESLDGYFTRKTALIRILLSKLMALIGISLQYTRVH